MTPQTADFFFLGLGVSLGALALYATSVWWRFRSVARDEEALQDE
jgi:hypothetical protein